MGSSQAWQGGSSDEVKMWMSNMKVYPLVNIQKAMENMSHINIYIYTLVAGFNHLEKYESQWEGLSHMLWKIKNVPNHQPVLYRC